MNATAKRWLKAGLQAVAIVAVGYAVLVVTSRSLDKGSYRMMCLKNLKVFGFAMQLYAGDNEQEIFQRADEMLHNTNFFRQMQLHWRYSRDGVYPVCPASPRRERHTYEGINAPNLTLTNTTPIAWEKKPYHDNQRNVLFFDGHVELVPEARFQALTNSLVRTK